MRAQGGKQSTAASGLATADACGGEDALPEAWRGSDRQRDREHGALALDISGVLGTTRTPFEMTPQLRATKTEAGRCREPLADLSARKLSGVAGGDERRPGLKDERLHLLGLTVECMGDL